MPPEFIRESEIWGPLFALGVLICGLFIASLTQLILQLILKRRKNYSSNTLSSQIITTIKGPLVLFIVILSVLLAFITLTKLTTHSWEFIDGFDTWARKVWTIVVIFEVAYLATRISQSLLAWYIRSIAARTNAGVENRLLPPVRRVLPLVIYSVGLLIALDSLDVAISPLLAGFGVGGLAVALAVQPTLSNFFAGTYLVTEGELKEGDFIELEGGPAGYVVDVGWRSTKIRSRYNNLVIIPNSKMIDSILTNYYSPTPAMNVIVECGVSYDTDLSKLEQIVLELTREVLDKSPHAVKDVEPFFGFSTFGESNINFFVFIQANDRTGSFILKSEIIKRIHTRFEKENIEINYPVRKILYPNRENTIVKEFSNQPVANQTQLESEPLSKEQDRN